VKNYALRFPDRATKKAGILMMDDSAKVGINILKMLFDVEDVKELKEKYPKAKYDSVMHGTYPTKTGAMIALAKDRGRMDGKGETETRTDS
jgi:hypothetical protein